jgi:hypothetical protein
MVYGAKNVYVLYAAPGPRLDTVGASVQILTRLSFIELLYSYAIINELDLGAFTERERESIAPMVGSLTRRIRVLAF